MIDHENPLQQVIEELSADIIVFSGDIDIASADRVIELTNQPTKENVLFILCTLGGDPHAAFKIARRLQSKYQKFILYVYGYCKSAGTIIAIGSDELVMSDLAEFGPLDVQLQEKDEIWRYSSGLNIDESIRTLKIETLDFFRSTLIDLVQGAGISTKTAAELATNLATGFINPIVSQIDPVRIGETQRAVKIALAYGERLTENKERGNLESQADLVKLVSGYPDHCFVIDYDEAEKIFRSVRKNNDKEISICELLKDTIRYPNKEALISKLNDNESTTDEQLYQQGDSKRVEQFEEATAGRNQTNNGEVLKIQPSRN